MKKTIGIYSIILGISIIALWIVLLISNNVPEVQTEPISIIFHLCAELLMGLMLLISGISLIRKSKVGDILFLISSGMVIYSIINSSGYYGNSGEWSMVTVFILILLVTLFFNSVLIRKYLK